MQPRLVLCLCAFVVCSVAAAATPKDPGLDRRIALTVASEPVLTALAGLPSRAGLDVVAPLPPAPLTDIMWPTRTLSVKDYLGILAQHLGMGWVLDPRGIVFLSPVEVQCQTFAGAPEGWIGYDSSGLDRRIARVRVLQGNTGTHRVARLLGSLAPARLGALVDGERLTAQQMPADEKREVASFLAWLRPSISGDASCRELRLFRLPWYMALHYSQSLDRRLMTDQSRSIAARPSAPVSIEVEQPITVGELADQITKRGGPTVTVDRRWSEVRVVCVAAKVPSNELVCRLARALGAPVREVGGAIHLGYALPTPQKDTPRGTKTPGLDFAVTIEGDTIRRGMFQQGVLSEAFPGFVMLAQCGKDMVQVIVFPHDASGDTPLVTASINCGLSSLRSLALLLGTPIAEERWRALLSKYNRPSLNMFDIVQAGQEVGLSLKGFQMSQAELAALSTPAIVSTDRFHFMALVAFLEQGVQVKDGDSDTTTTMPTAEFASRYGGYALVPATAAGGLPEAR